MRLTETALPGVVIIDCETFPDARGSFSRVWHVAELSACGFDAPVTQCTTAFNHRRGTVRGMHYQAPPMGEVKLVRATRGAIFDVAVDLRPDSPTFRRWIGLELSADNRRTLLIPIGLAHGYQTLTDDAEVMYFMSSDYSPPHQRGVRWNDPAFGIEWPLGEPTMINDRDRTYPDFSGESRP